jgi:hypothetical protein
MTNLNRSTQIPPSITTLEEISAWSLFTLYNLHKNSRYKETDDAALVPLITLQQGLASDKTERVIFRVSFEINPEFFTGSLKVWDYIQEFASTSIPANFTT